MPLPATDPQLAAQAMNMGDAGYTPAQIAPEVGLPAGTVHDIIHRHRRWGEIAEKPVFRRLRETQNQTLEAAFRAGAAQLFAKAFDEDKLAKASTYQLVTSAAISIDKARLLAGESTANIDLHVKAELVGMEQLCAALSRTLVDVSRETPVDTLHDNSINPPK